MTPSLPPGTKPRPKYNPAPTEPWVNWRKQYKNVWVNVTYLGKYNLKRRNKRYGLFLGSGLVTYILMPKRRFSYISKMKAGYHAA